MRSRALSALFALLVALPVHGSPPLREDQVRFRTLGSDHGLSHPTARALAEDRLGFIWVGTQDGLNRFDGHEFVSFDRGLLGDAHVTALTADTDGDGLWVGTLGGGLLHFDLASLTVQRVELPEGEITALLQEDSGLWVGSANAPPQLVRDAGHPPLRQLPDLPGLRAPRALLRIGPQVLLLCGDDGLLAWHDDRADTQRWPRDATVEPRFECRGLVRVGASVYAATSRGLLQLSPQGELLRRLGRDDGLPDDDVRALAVLGDDELWIGGTQGLAMLDLSTGSLLQWQHHSGDASSVAGNRIGRLLVDRRGLLWVGTWTAGVSLHDPATRALSFIREREGRPDSLPASAVRAVVGDVDGSLWLGLSDAGGLVHAAADGRVLELHRPDPVDPRSLPSALVRHALRHSSGVLWVATNGGGLARQAPDGSFERLGPVDGGSGLLPSRVVTTLAETRDGSLWIGTEDAGLWRQCAGCTDFERIGGADAPADRRLPDGRVMDIAEDASGALWVGYFGDGLARIDVDGRVSHFDRRSTPALPGDVVVHLLPAADGSLWIATWGAGLAQLQPTGRGWHSRSWGQPAGLRSNTLAGLLFDDAGMLWVSHGRGIDRFDPRSGRASPLSLSDGVDRSGYYPGAAWREADGRLNFGGWSGWMRFDPRQLALRRDPLPVRLTGFSIFNRPVLPQTREPESPLTVEIARADALALPYAARMFSMSFSALDHAAAAGTRYRFRLRGLDADWIQASAAQRIATYAGPPPGNYLLEIDAAAIDADTFTPGVRLPVQVLPPWWGTLWARALFALLIAAMLAMLLRARQQRLRAKQAAVAELRRSREQLSLALWGSRDELWDLDLERGDMQWQNPIDYVHPDLHRCYATREEFFALLHSDDRDRLQAAWSDHIDNRAPFFEASYRVPRRDGGGWVWLLSRGQAVRRDTDGRALQIIGTNRDISALKDVEASLREINENLEQRVDARTRDLSAANERLNGLLDELRRTQQSLIEQEKMASLGGLVAGVAHELNTPLGIALTAASAVVEQLADLNASLADGKLTRTKLDQFREMLAEAMALVLGSLQRSSTLVSSFKQVAVDQTSEQQRRFELDAFLGDVAASLQPLCRTAGCRLSIDCAAGIVVDSYPGALFQILTNLLGNALMHAFPHGGGEVRIDGGLAGDVVEIRCSDDGVGMSADVAKQAFEPFFTTRRNTGGAGLGLHICYNLATRLLGGSLLLETAPGAGCRFTLSIPNVAPNHPTGDAAKALRTARLDEASRSSPPLSRSKGGGREGSAVDVDVAVVDVAASKD